MMMFEPLLKDQCCLCGASGDLTGEHKIKASAIREIFGNDPTYIGHFDGSSEPRLAQGPKSKALHFGARLCTACNGSRTQAADRAFDRFQDKVAANVAAGATDLYPADDYPHGASETLDVFRYFGKQLACQIADAGGPRLPGLALFTLSEIDFNPIKMFIQPDPTYQDYTELSGDTPGFAGHGGLVVNHSRRTGQLSGFHSTLTLGPVQYVYWVEFMGSVATELVLVAPGFFASAQKAHADALITPMTAHQRRKLGYRIDAQDDELPTQ